MKIYRVSKFPIITFMLAGIILIILPFGDIKGILTNLPLFIGLLCLAFLFLGYSLYLLKNRKKGFYWDDEGVVIDLKGTKVFWHEIEDIQFYKSSTAPMRSTVIYPHYTNHEKIRIRRKKLMPTPAHSIEWMLIESPKEYHDNLMKAWEEKKRHQ